MSGHISAVYIQSRLKAITQVSSSYSQLVENTQTLMTGLIQEYLNIHLFLLER